MRTILVCLLFIVWVFVGTGEAGPHAVKDVGGKIFGDEIVVATAAAGTFAVSLAATPVQWKITNLDGTNSVYFNPAGTASTSHYKIGPGLSLEGVVPRTSFDLYADSGTISVQVYSTYIY